MERTPDNDLPEFKAAEEPIASKPFRGREKPKPKNNPIDEEGLPSINKKGSGSNLVKNILSVLLLAVLGAAIWAINAPKNEKVKEDTKPTTSSTTRLPPLEVPKQLTPPAPAPKPTSDAVASGAPAGAPPPIRPAGGQAQGSSNQANTRSGKQPLTWQERKLLGQNAEKTASKSFRTGNKTPANAGDQSAGTQPGQTSGAIDGSNRLAARMQPTAVTATTAALLKNRDYMLTRGNSIGCTLETAIDTTLPGLVTCYTTEDIYGATHDVLLMERGTLISGEQQGSIKRGEARVFTLFNRAETPHGVVIDLNSPGADNLGRGGLEGWVDHHFIERFAAAGLYSIFDASLKYAVEREKEGGNTTVISDSTDEGSNVVEKILDEQISIPDTLLKNQGEEIRIMVARDLDFSTVYELRAQP
ncbi:TrbI/VirB10 family protein [Metapseudomonas otitidis]|uniref:TrbI/VirB10 family protein n=1 Tax=Metapseudomonas otitidis TaxID=319939 RepID=UPI000D1BC8B5|nr:TrbI/VirB10 family protein [Pseudomonas otitidis]